MQTSTLLPADAHVMKTIRFMGHR